jgi:signal transduction histidine kinase
MINNFITFLFAAILSILATPVLSQPHDTVNGYSVQHFTDENGLPQNSINDLLFDKDGYLWLASQAGLARFNGQSFKLYYPNDKPVMESNIVSLGKNEKGLLYFQTLDHRLYCYGGNNPQSLSPVDISRLHLLLNRGKQVFDFTRFLRDTRSNEERMRRNAIFQRLFASPNNFFVADTGHVYLIDRDSLYYYDGDLHPLSAMEGHRAKCLVYDHRFYVLSRDSVTAVYADGRKISPPARIDGDLRRDLAPDPGGNIPAARRGNDPATQESNIPAARRGNGPATQEGNAPAARKGNILAAREGNIPAGPNHSFRLFSCGRMHHLLVGHRLYRLLPEKDGRIQSRFLVDLDFIPSISSIEYNAGLDLLLISTNTEGFYFLRRNHFRRSDWPMSTQDQMDEHRFGPMALHKDKEILTDKFIFTPAGNLTPVKGRGPVWQRCLFIDRDDAVWAARDSIPRKLSSTMDSLKNFPPLDANVVDYAQDTDGKLYCLTERSLWKLDSGRFTRIYTAIRKDGQQSETMAFLAPHRIWIAVPNGLIEYDVEKQAARSFPEFAGKHVRSIHICRNGSILLGTYGEGYYYYYNNRFFRMPMDKNEFLVTAHCFLEDRKGYIWIPCNKGLFKVPKADMDAWCAGGGRGQLYYYYYGRQDGLRTNEFNGGFNPSGVITTDGFISLLSMKGTVCFYADSLKTDFPGGSIVMTHLEIDGQSLARTDTIDVPAGYNSLTLEVSSPYLGNRNNLYLQYKVPGLSDKWQEMPEDGTLDLHRLAPGHYTLQVRKVNGFGNNNYQYRQWRIVVMSYFYQAPWFRALAVIIVLGLLFVSLQLGLKLVEKQKEVKIKEQALLRTHRQREKLISLVIHDLRSPLRFLTMLAGDLHDNQETLSQEELKDRTYWVKKGAQDVYHFSEDFLLWVTSQKDNFKVRKQLFFVRPLLQEIYDFYLEQVLQKGNRLAYSADPSLQVYSDPHLMITIIRNLTDNANKYTSRGEIRIEARQEGGNLLVLVADTGRGMNPEQAAAFLGEGSLDNVKSGSQLGHQFVVDLTQRLNGTLSIETGEQKGTTVYLRLPMQPAPDAASA